MVQYLRIVFEAVFLIGLLYVIFLRLRVLNALRSLGAFKLGIFMLFFGFWMFVQLIDRWQYQFPDKKVEFFPIARFAMFEGGGRIQTVQTYEFAGRFSDGRTEYYAPSDILRGAGVSTMSTKINNIILSALSSGDSEKVSWAKAEIGKYGKSIYNVLQFQGKDLPDSLDFQIVNIDLTKTTKDAVSKDYQMSVKNPFKQ
ncbi:hypothetical protein [Emticicia sp. TH156]|uniref:hypothetical protein n=1 Tax=Emticicia sp. TH156 TaxID=2067454 RepID=UPI000C777C75|nr:hypothetical protein [Emticicia sp. TH156]PLK44018.1 hypothetical protein C0V77_12765 [Emticicia sp. TH156]